MHTVFSSIDTQVKLIKEIKKISKSKISYIFVPHLIPTFRGMLTSIYLDLKPGIKITKIFSELKKYHKNNFFVKIKTSK